MVFLQILLFPFSLCAWTQLDPLSCPADPSFSCCFSASVMAAACPLGWVLHVWPHCNPRWHVLPYIHYTFWLLNSSFFCMSSTLKKKKSEFTFRGHKSENRKYPPHTHTSGCGMNWARWRWLTSLLVSLIAFLCSGWNLKCSPKKTHGLQVGCQVMGFGDV